MGLGRPLGQPRGVNADLCRDSVPWASVVFEGLGEAGREGGHGTFCMKLLQTLGAGFMLTLPPRSAHAR